MFLERFFNDPPPHSLPFDFKHLSPLPPFSSPPHPPPLPSSHKNFVCTQIPAVWCLSRFIQNPWGLWYQITHRPMRLVKIQISLKSVWPVVLISSSVGESDGSKLNEKSEDYVFLQIFPYGGGGGGCVGGRNGMTFSPGIHSALHYFLMKSRFKDSSRIDHLSLMFV